MLRVPPAETIDPVNEYEIGAANPTTDSQNSKTPTINLVFKHMYFSPSILSN